MMKELHLMSSNILWVVSAFQLCYTIAQPITGLLIGCHRTENRLLYLCLVVVADQHGAHALTGGWISHSISCVV